MRKKPFSFVYLFGIFFILFLFVSLVKVDTVKASDPNFAFFKLFDENGTNEKRFGFQITDGQDSASFSQLSDAPDSPIKAEWARVDANIEYDDFEGNSYGSDWYTWDERASNLTYLLSKQTSVPDYSEGVRHRIVNVRYRLETDEGDKYLYFDKIGPAEEVEGDFFVWDARDLIVENPDSESVEFNFIARPKNYDFESGRDYSVSCTNCTSGEMSIVLEKPILKIVFYPKTYLLQHSVNLPTVVSYELVGEFPGPVTKKSTFTLNINIKEPGSGAGISVSPSSTIGGTTDIDSGSSEGREITVPDVSVLNKLGTTDISEIIGKIIKGAMGVMGSIALVMIIYGGFLWMTAAGNAEKSGKSAQILLWSTLGIVLIFASYAVVDIVFEAFR